VEDLAIRQWTHVWKATKIHWRIIGDSIEHIRPSNLPGEWVSNEKMENTTQSLIAQLKGTTTTQRYR
jgi:hypothetical protein